MTIKKMYIRANATLEICNEVDISTLKGLKLYNQFLETKANSEQHVEEFRNELANELGLEDDGEFIIHSLEMFEGEE